MLCKVWGKVRANMLLIKRKELKIFYVLMALDN